MDIKLDVLKIDRGLYVLSYSSEDLHGIVTAWMTDIPSAVRSTDCNLLL